MEFSIKDGNENELIETYLKSGEGVEMVDGSFLILQEIGMVLAVRVTEQTATGALPVGAQALSKSKSYLAVVTSPKGEAYLGVEVRHIVG